MDGYVGSWQKPSKEDLIIIKRSNTRRFLDRYKSILLGIMLFVILVYLLVWVGVSSKNGVSNENNLTMTILSLVLLFIIIVFFIIYKVLHKTIYGKGKEIEEVNHNTKFLYHQLVSGVNDKEQLYAIIVSVDNQKMELLVHKRDYDKINEDTKLFVGRYVENKSYKYYIFY